MPHNPPNCQSLAAGLRATVHIYNDEDDVDRLLAALQDV
jgi:selenocysteine lyase/cysteine desulfurase